MAFRVEDRDREGIGLTRYSAKDLRGMTLKSLAEVGAGLKPALTFTKHHNRATRARTILAAYSEADTRSIDTSKSTRKESGDQPTDLHEQKPAFEHLCENSAHSEVIGDDTQENRGGVRAGQGRPEGMTNELAFYNSLPQQPHPAIRDAIEVLFKTWAARANCDEVALTPDQAIDLAIPWTQMAHLTGLTDIIPAWLMVAMACIWSTANMVTAKASIASAAVEPEPAKEAA